MALSESANFQLTCTETIEAAYQKIGAFAPGQTSLTPDQFKRGLRNLNLLVQHLQLDGIRLWTRERSRDLYLTNVASSAVTVLTSGQNTYWLPTDTLEVSANGVEIVNSSSVGTLLSPMTQEEWMAESAKTTTGTPTRFLIEQVYFTDSASSKSISARLKLTLHPVPTSSHTTSSIYYLRTRKLYDFDASSNDPDMPQRWQRMLVYGLAYDLAVDDGMPLNERAALQSEFEREKVRVKTNDSEGGNLSLCPELPYTWRY